jgi:hypothetical protein
MRYLAQLHLSVSGASAFLARIGFPLTDLLMMLGDPRSDDKLDAFSAAATLLLEVGPPEPSRGFASSWCSRSQAEG